MRPLIGILALVGWFTPGTTLAAASWASLGLGGDSIIALAIDPSSPATLYAGTDGAGVFKSTDGGASWAAINSGLPDLTVNLLAIDPATPSTLYASVYGSGVFKSTDGGSNWADVNAGLTYLQILALAVDPTTPSTLYAGAIRNGVFKSTDGGASWAPIDNGLTDLYILALAINPATPTTLYAGTPSGAFESTNAGRSWTFIGFPDAGGVNALAIDPAHPTIVYAATSGGVFRSSDGGTSWRSTNSGLTGVKITSLAIDPFNTDTLYAAAYLSSSSGVFKTTNSGGSWTAINSGLTNPSVTALAIDPTTPSTIYAGTLGGLFVLGSTSPTACSSPADSLLLQGSRFNVAVSWTDFSGKSGCGAPVQLTPDTGYFWFFDSSNVELIIKVLDGRAVNQEFWVFYGSLSSVEYDVTVRDTVSGQVKHYHNPSGQLRSVADTSAFGPFSPASAAAVTRRTSTRVRAGAASAKAGAACSPTASSLCVNQGRFRVSVVWRDHAGNVGTGTAVPITPDTGYFWFFNSSNVELVVKVLDGRGLNGEFWVFFGALSDVNYIVTVTDTQTGFVKAYVNPDGTLGSRADTSAMSGSETRGDAIARIPGTLSTVRALVGSLASSSDGPTSSLAAHVQTVISALDECLRTALQTGLAQCQAHDLKTGNAITVAIDAEAAQLAIGLLGAATGPENPATAASRLSRDAVSGNPYECRVPAIVALAQAQSCNALSGTSKSIGINNTITYALLASSGFCLAGFVPACEMALGELADIGLAGALIQFAACDFASIVPYAISVQPPKIALGPGESAAFDLTLAMAAKQQFAGPLSTIIGLSIGLLESISPASRVALASMATILLGPVLASQNLAPEPSCVSSAPASVASASLLPPTGTGISLADRSVAADSGAKPGARAMIVPQTSLAVAKTEGEVEVNPVAISPTSQHFPQTGGSDFVAVAEPDNRSWKATVSKEYNWITITSRESQTGPGKVFYSVDANNTTADRRGWIMIDGLQFTVTQAWVTVSPPSQAFGAAGGSDSVELHVPVGFSWTAVPNDKWITIDSGSSGTGPGTVNYSVARNPDATPRPGGLTWLEPSGPAIATFTITQAGASSCPYSLSATSKPIGSNGGSDSVKVTAPSGCPWTAVVSSGNDWLTITSVSSPSGNGTVDYAVGVNPDTSERTGTMTIAGLAFSVVQAGKAASGYYYANWNCETQPQCISVIGHDVGSAGPFCSSAACTTWKNTNFQGATCDTQPSYPIYYPPPPGSACLN